MSEDKDLAEDNGSEQPGRIDHDGAFKRMFGVREMVADFLMTVLEPDWKHANRVPRYIGFEITFGDDDRITESVSWKFSLGQVS